MTGNYRLLAVLALGAALVAGGCAAQPKQPDSLSQSPSLAQLERAETPPQADAGQRKAGPETARSVLQEEQLPAAEVAALQPAVEPALPAAPAAGEKQTGLEIVYFGFDRHDVGSDALAAVGRNFDRLRPGTRLLLEGHTDEIGDDDYNLSLGERRATNVMKYLATRGIPQEHLRIISYGLDRPADPGHSDEAHARNRRVVFVIEQ